MRALRDKIDEHKGREQMSIRERKQKYKNRRETRHKRLLNMEKKQRVAKRVVGGGGMG